MIDQLTTDSSLGFHRRGARVTQACCRLLYRPLCCRCLASEGVPQRVLMARAGERDDRDAHEGLLASISHARRSPRRALSTQVSYTPLLPNDGRGVQGRELMARAGERDDRDAHEGLLASISRARRSPLVSLQADVQILLRASRIRTSTWLQPAEACCRLRGARSTRLRSISRSARMGVASKLANKHAQMSSGMVLSHLCLTR